jgi:hypothetical protein
MLEQYLNFLQEDNVRQKHFVLQESQYMGNEIIRDAVRQAEKETEWRRSRDKCRDQTSFFKQFREKHRLSYQLCLIKNEIRFIKRAIAIAETNITKCKRDRPCRTQVEYTIDRSRDAIVNLERTKEAIEYRLEQISRRK